jgi:hypothetical protein
LVPLAITAAEFSALALGIFGLGGIIFTALKFNRDDTTAIVAQQTQILSNMHTLNDELRATADRLREERDGLAAQVEKLTVQVRELRGDPA